MEELLRQNLLLLADAYAIASGRSLQSLGRECLRDGSFFLRLRSGDGFTVKTFDKVVMWFSDNWPSDSIWPGDVPRPATAEVAA